MATFLGRRYMRAVEAVGRREQMLGGVILLLVAGLVVGFVLHVAQSERPAAVDQPAVVNQTSQAVVLERLPAVNLDGWHGPTESAYFSADRMYEKIDGQAEQYLQLGAVGLTFGRYEKLGEEQLAIDVYCFHMRTAADARNAYLAEKPAGATEIATGAAGYEVGGAVFLIQDTHYLQLLPSQPDEQIAATARRLADRLAEHLAQRPASAPAADTNADE